MTMKFYISIIYIYMYDRIIKWMQKQTENEAVHSSTIYHAL